MKPDPVFMSDLNALIAKEASRYRLEELRDTDWTIQRMMSEQRLSEPQARKVLDKLAADGHFTKVKVPNPNGGGCRVAYRPLEKK